MVPVRTSIEIRRGERVEMLFTPRLYCFKGLQGVTLSGDTSELAQVFSLYADILFCAALNAWTLEGNDVEDAPFRRADFHEFSASNPQEFGKTINFALKALSGKSIKDFINCSLRYILKSHSRLASAPEICRSLKASELLKRK